MINFKENKKALLITGTILAGLGFAVSSQFPKSTEEVFKTYNYIADTESVEIANTYLKNTYDGKGLFANWEEKCFAEVLSKSIKKLEQEFIDQYGASAQDINNVIITDVEIEPASSTKYCNVNIMVKNNSSKSFSYIKINLYFEDKNGNVIRSEWTNDSGTVKPGATQKIDKITESDFYSVSAEIADIRFER